MDDRPFTGEYPTDVQDYWLGIAEHLTREIKRLEREKIELATTLVLAAGGLIEISSFDKDAAIDMESGSEKNFERDSTVYVTRRRRKPNLDIPT